MLGRRNFRAAGSLGHEKRPKTFGKTGGPVIERRASIQSGMMIHDIDGASSESVRRRRQTERERSACGPVPAPTWPAYPPGREKTLATVPATPTAGPTVTAEPTATAGRSSTVAETPAPGQSAGPAALGEGGGESARTGPREVTHGTLAAPPAPRTHRGCDDENSAPGQLGFAERSGLASAASLMRTKTAPSIS